MQKKLNKTIKNFKEYLDIIQTLSKPLNSEQKKQLDRVLSSQLTLLVALKRDSGLGHMSINWLEERRR